MSTQVPEDANEWTLFGDVARGLLGEQCQYAARYVNGWGSFPDLGYGLRFQGDPTDYHSLTIHKQDVAEFVERVLAWRARCTDSCGPGSSIRRA